MRLRFRHILVAIIALIGAHTASAQYYSWGADPTYMQWQILKGDKIDVIYPDTAPFQEAVMPLHNEVLAASPALQPIYDMIQAYNAQYASAE